MRKRFKDIWRLTAIAHRQRKKAEYKLVVYWASMLMVIFSLIFLILSVTGFFSALENGLKKTLEINLQRACAAVEKQVNSLEARGTALSRECSRILNDKLSGNDFSSLCDDREGLLDCQRLFYPRLYEALESSPCSGAYVILNTTSNTSLSDSDIFRSGLYLRYSSLCAVSTANRDVTCFRGMPELARENGIRLHNRWEPETKAGTYRGFTACTETFDGDVSKRCIWNDRYDLSDIWEEAFLLFVPIAGDNGKIYGACGMEVSELYFKLDNPVTDSEYGGIVTLIAPLEDDALILKRGMVGMQSGMSLDDENTLQIGAGKCFKIYNGEYGSYYGLHKALALNTEDGIPLALAVLMPIDGYASMVIAAKLRRLAYSALVLAASVILCVILSRKFIRPFTESLDAIRNGENKTDGKGAYEEIDILFELLDEKEEKYKNRIEDIKRESLIHKKDVDRLVNLSVMNTELDEMQTFIVGVSTLSPAERRIYDMYVEGKSTKEIMQERSITENTLKFHSRNIYGKLGVCSKKELRLTALKIRQTESK